VLRSLVINPVYFTHAQHGRPIGLKQSAQITIKRRCRIASGGDEK